MLALPAFHAFGITNIPSAECRSLNSFPLSFCASFMGLRPSSNETAAKLGEQLVGERTGSGQDQNCVPANFPNSPLAQCLCRTCLWKGLPWWKMTMPYRTRTFQLWPLTGPVAKTALSGLCERGSGSLWQAVPLETLPWPMTSSGGISGARSFCGPSGGTADMASATVTSRKCWKSAAAGTKCVLSNVPSGSGQRWWASWCHCIERSLSKSPSSKDSEERRSQTTHPANPANFCNRAPSTFDMATHDVILRSDLLWQRQDSLADVSAPWKGAFS